MLRMFGSEMDGEARPLIKDITDSFRFDDLSIIVSLSIPPSEYYRMLLPTFDKWVRINDDGSIVTSQNTM
jgi:hypothetical protein